MKNNTRLEAALSYIQRGWYVLPVHSTENNTCTCGNPKCSNAGKHPRTKNGLKDATVDEKIIKEWWSSWPNSNIGIRTGNISGFFVIDVDDKPQKDKFGSEELKDIESAHENLPETPESMTPSGGRHIFLSTGGHDLKNTTDFPRKGLDIRANGGYIVAPPSNIYGKEYVWEASSDINEIPLAQAPDWLIGLLKEGKKTRLQTHTINIIKEGSRNDTLTKIAGKLHNISHFGLEELYDSLLKINEKKCDPPLSDKDVYVVAKSVFRYEKNEITLHNSLTDTWNAKTMHYLFGHSIKYCDSLKGWYLWNKKYWKHDNKYKMYKICQKTSQVILEKFNKLKDKDKMDEKKQKAILAHIAKMQSKQSIENMITLLKAENDISQDSEAFDSNPWLLNCKNGTLDLEHGTFYPQKKEDLITKCIKYDYEPDAKCPEWMSFLNAIFDNNAETIAFIQRAIGYSLSGDVNEDCIFIFYGTGANGKTTFLTTILNLLGPYALTTPADTLLKKKGDAPLNDIARLKGHRFVVCAESGKSRYMDEARVKQLTGGDIIPARFLYKEYFEFYSTFKIFFATNNLPIISEFGKGIWRRLIPIPFERAFEGENEDKDLVNKLKKESSGILTWAVEGFKIWQKQGLGTAEKIQKLKEEYQDVSDIIGIFLREECIISDKASISSTALWEHFKEWQSKFGGKKIGRPFFYAYLKSKGIEKTADGSKRIFKKIGLLSKMKENDEKIDEKDDPKSVNESVNLTEKQEKNGCQDSTSIEKQDDIYFESEIKEDWEHGN